MCLIVTISEIIYTIFDHIVCLYAIIILSLSVLWGRFDKVSPKPDLKIKKSVEETCFAVGFVRKSCKNGTNTGSYTIQNFINKYEI